MGAGELGGGDDALDRHRRIGERDIVAHRGIEQYVFLQHDADLAPQPGGIDHAEIDAIDKDAPALRHVKPLDQLGERALARARGTDDADNLSGRHAESHVMQDLRAVDAVAERDMLKSDVAADRRQRRLAGIVSRLGNGVQDIAEPLHRQPRLVEILPDLREAQNRRADAAGQNIEGDKLADREIYRR